MNRLQYRHAFAKRYHERTGNYCVGWRLSKAAANRARRSASYRRMKSVVQSWPPHIVCAIALSSMPKAFRPPSTQKRYRVNIGYAHTTPFTGIRDEIALRNRAKFNELALSSVIDWPAEPTTNNFYTNKRTKI